MEALTERGRGGLQKLWASNKFPVKGAWCNPATQRPDKAAWPAKGDTVEGRGHFAAIAQQVDIAIPVEYTQIQWLQIKLNQI